MKTIPLCETVFIDFDESILREIKSRWREVYPADQNGKGITCPICRHGSRSHKHGVEIYKHSKGDYILHCFDCKFTGSVIDLKMQEMGIGFVEAVKELADQLHILLPQGDKTMHDDKNKTVPAEYDGYYSEEIYQRELAEQEKIGAAFNRAFAMWHSGVKFTEKQVEWLVDNWDLDCYESERALFQEYGFIDANGNITEYGEGAVREYNKKASPENTGSSADTSPQGKKDYAEFFDQCHTALKENETALQYLHDRGITDQDIEKYRLGFMRDKYNVPRIVIPYSMTKSEYYIARRIDGQDGSFKYMKPATEEAGAEPLYYGDCITADNEPVFIVEGTFDAMAIMNNGGKAVALNTTGDCEPLKVEVLKNKDTYKGVYVICEDNDDAGKRGLNRLKSFFDDNSIKYIVYDISGSCKDANELYNTDREQFKSRVDEAIKEALYYDQKELLEQQETYRGNSAGAYLNQFLEDISNSSNNPAIPTGFKALDRCLDGGLYKGLYVCGAISSLGKTTLILQMADQMAQRGNDVLIFSLEMGKNELISKSISRHTLSRCLDAGLSTGIAKTSRGITSGERYKTYNHTEVSNIKESINDYSEYADHIYIFEGIGDIGVQQIREAVEKHIKLTGNNPIVIIDYIQILAPYNPRSTDKQNMDKAVMELKRISRDFSIPVIGISSLNRANYKTVISMEAFKESGAIEYSADVLIGLQFKGVENKNFDVDEAKKKSPRDIELVLLKNRDGITGSKVAFKYYPAFNYFEEA